MKIFLDEVEENILEAIIDYLKGINRIDYLKGINRIDYPKDPKTPRVSLLKDLLLSIFNQVFYFDTNISYLFEIGLF